MAARHLSTGGPAIAPDKASCIWALSGDENNKTIIGTTANGLPGGEKEKV